MENLQIKRGEGQNLERRNVERPIFRNFEIANIKIMKDELSDNFIFEFNCSFLEIIWTPKILNNFSSCGILIFQMVELHFFIIQIVKFYKIVTSQLLYY